MPLVHGYLLAPKGFYDLAKSQRKAKLYGLDLVGLSVLTEGCYYCYIFGKDKSILEFVRQSNGEFAPITEGNVFL